MIYRAEANPGVDGAEELLTALRQSFIDKIPLETVFREATAFTHSRRIFLMQVVHLSGGSFDELLEASGMSSISLQWNLSKLEARGFVKACGGLYEAGSPKNPLGNCLMRLVCSPALRQWEIVRVISGGQTGADRAALDAAITCGVPHGGWCPKGRLSEEGPIPSVYHLEETESGEYPVRTRMNVEAADLTVIFTQGLLSGGSFLTQQFAEELGKPWMHMDLSDPVHPLEKMIDEVPSLEKFVLNVAGPRASNDPKIYTAVYEVMVHLLRTP